MIKSILITILPLLLLLPVPAQAQTVDDFAVQVSATILENPSGLSFSWPQDPTAEQYYVFRKLISDTTWTGPVAVLPGSATGFTDWDIGVGEAYEYGFYRSLNFFTETTSVAHGTDLVFSIYDTWGDGISPHYGLGWYQVSGSNTVYARGGDFGSVETTYFSVDAGGSGNYSDIVVSLQLDVFGEETSWELSEEGSGTILLSGDGYESPRFGHIFAGIEYPFTEFRGSVLLVVDETIANSLTEELERLKLDLICDGWTVRRIDVDRNAPVTSVREMILAQCSMDPEINSMLLFGHIPVPYSGNIMSSHTDHCGAYPADVYYAEHDVVWTDSIVNNTTASRPENHNVPGDGKFDNTVLESGVDLMCGRVDLYDMPAFSLSEVELLQRYLDKNHEFRRCIREHRQRGLIDDNVGVVYGVAPACNGLRNFATMFSADSVHQAKYFNIMDEEDYLWSMGCGPSNYTSCGGVGSTEDFATTVVHSVFTILYGSYFVDWDNTNNLLRAPLGAEGSLLTNCWAGAPNWHFHHMSLGETIGYSTRISQSNMAMYAPTARARQVHAALMGDPTLRQHPVAPPSSLGITVTGCSVDLSWLPSTDEETLGYHVYRASSIDGQFQRITSDLMTGCNWTDNSPLYGRNVYMVRGCKLQVSSSGSYFNLSLGIADSTEIISSDLGPNPPEASYLFQSFPNPFSESAQIDFYLAGPGLMTLSVYDMQGRIVAEIYNGELTDGLHSLQWNGLSDDGNPLGNGVYLIKFSSPNGSMNRRLSIVR